MDKVSLPDFPDLQPRNPPQTEGPTGPAWTVRIPTERETIVREMLPRAVAAYIAGTTDEPAANGAALVTFLYTVADEFILQRSEGNDPPIRERETPDIESTRGKYLTP